MLSGAITFGANISPLAAVAVGEAVISGVGVSVIVNPGVAVATTVVVGSAVDGAGLGAQALSKMATSMNVKKRDMVFLSAWFNSEIITFERP